ncbi:hypothetical protein AHF37_05767 [Paragonimus kellicotti]|nr:hypothetical protein AHF37_05767 [Paragonimus kellicotti]
MSGDVINTTANLGAVSIYQDDIVRAPSLPIPGERLFALLERFCYSDIAANPWKCTYVLLFGISR